MASNDRFTCSSANFSTNGISYQRVCGRARGYQKGTTTGFYGTNSRTIDQDYVAGLSVTHSRNPRQHIWTYASGWHEQNTKNACPCSGSKGYTAPSFVGSNYYCESGAQIFPSSNRYYFNDPLWDGAGCIDNCCDDSTQPWFQHKLNETTQDDIEARICVYGPFSDRSVLIDQLELYIQ